MIPRVESGALNPYPNRASTSRIAPALFLAITLLIAPCALAQQPDLSAAAKQTAAALQSAGLKRVVVLDFVGPDQKLTALGSKLADELSAALSQADSNLNIEDRSKLPDYMQKEAFSPELVTNVWGALALADSLKAEAAVFGTFSQEGDRVKLVFTATRLSDDKQLSSAEASIPITDEAVKLMHSNVEDPDRSLPSMPEKGGHLPFCTFCPQALATQRSIRAGLTRERVFLLVVISREGRVEDIQVIKGLPYGLTASAIETVKGWRLHPATSRNGKPFAIRHIIEVDFRSL